MGWSDDDPLDFETRPNRAAHAPPERSMAETKKARRVTLQKTPEEDQDLSLEDYMEGRRRAKKPRLPSNEDALLKAIELLKQIEKEERGVEDESEPGGGYESDPEPGSGSDDSESEPDTDREENGDVLYMNGDTNYDLETTQRDDLTTQHEDLDATQCDYESEEPSEDGEDSSNLEGAAGEYTHAGPISFGFQIPEAFTFKGRERSVWDWWKIWNKKDKFKLALFPEREGEADRPEQTLVYGDASADGLSPTADLTAPVATDSGSPCQQAMSDQPSLDPLGADEEDIPAFPYDVCEGDTAGTGQETLEEDEIPPPPVPSSPPIVEIFEIVRSPDGTLMALIEREGKEMHLIQCADLEAKLGPLYTCYLEGELVVVKETLTVCQQQLQVAVAQLPLSSPYAQHSLGAEDADYSEHDDEISMLTAREEGSVHSA